MKYTVVTLSLLLLASFTAAQDVIEVENTVTDNDNKYYTDEGKVGYIAMWSTERTEDGVEREAIYKNMSIERWTAMKTNHLGEDKVEEKLEEEFGDAARNISTGVTQGEDIQHFAIEVTYNINQNYPFSYEELEEKLPDRVEGTIHYEDYTGTATIPVVTKKENRTIDETKIGFGETKNATGQINQDRKDSSEETKDKDEEGGLISAILSLLPF